mgnify:CR=1 FL=1
MQSRFEMAHPSLGSVKRLVQLCVDPTTTGAAFATAAAPFPLALPLCDDQGRPRQIETHQEMLLAAVLEHGDLAAAADLFGSSCSRARAAQRTLLQLFAAASGHAADKSVIVEGSKYSCALVEKLATLILLIEEGKDLSAVGANYGTGAYSATKFANASRAIKNISRRVVSHDILYSMDLHTLDFLAAPAAGSPSPRRRSLPWLARTFSPTFRSATVVEGGHQRRAMVRVRREPRRCSSWAGWCAVSILCFFSGVGVVRQRDPVRGPAQSPIDGRAESLQPPRPSPARGDLDRTMRGAVATPAALRAAVTPAAAGYRLGAVAPDPRSGGPFPAGVGTTPSDIVVAAARNVMAAHIARAGITATEARRSRTAIRRPPRSAASVHRRNTTGTTSR